MLLLVSLVYSIFMGFATNHYICHFGNNGDKHKQVRHVNSISSVI